MELIESADLTFRLHERETVMSGLFNWLALCGETSANPVPRGLATRRTGAGGLPSGRR